MSGRLERLRKRRSAVQRSGSGTAADAEETTIEMGMVGTLGSVLVLLAIGAALATAYIIRQNPECMGFSQASNVAAPSVSNNVRVASKSQDTAPKVAQLPPPPPPKPAPPPPDRNALTQKRIDTCEGGHLSLIRQQLPLGGCQEAPFLQRCSFTVATTRNMCMTTTTPYLRQPYATAILPANVVFRAVFVGCTANDATPIDVLAMGSHDTAKYNAEKFKDNSGSLVGSCPLEKITPSPNKQAAQAVCFHWNSFTTNAIRAQATAMGLSSAEYDVVDVTFSENPSVPRAPTTLDGWIQQKWPNSNDPIHYLRIGTGGQDYDMLLSGPETLKQVRYLEFEYNHKGPWGEKELKTLIEKELKGKYAMDCYWKGASDHFLWRITGCWQDYYAYRHWSFVACVSTVHEDAKPIQDAMADSFLQTLRQKDLVFAKKIE